MGQIITARGQLDRRLNRRGTTNTTRAFALQGLYLLGVRAFESFIEEQLFSLATGSTTWAPRVVNGQDAACTMRLLENRREILTEIIYKNRQYATFLPYVNTITVAKFLFERGEPFVLLSKDDREVLARCSKVRNYIAHNSVSARKEFLEEANKIRSFRRTSRRVTDYLDSSIRNEVTYFDHDVSTLVRVATFLT